MSLGFIRGEWGVLTGDDWSCVIRVWIGVTNIVRGS